MPPAEAETAVTAAEGDHDDVPAAKHDPQKTAEAIAEFRFYLEHGMPEQASAAFEKIQSLTSDEATLTALRAEIETASQNASADEAAPEVEAVSEFTIDEPAAEFAVEDAPPPAPETPAVVEPRVPVAEKPAPPALHVAPEPPVKETPAAPAPRVFAGRDFSPGRSPARTRYGSRTCVRSFETRTHCSPRT
jgi:hypothetical protein